VPRRTGGEPLLTTPTGDEGCAVGATLGTSWHGLLESDELRRNLLIWVAARRGLDFTPGRVAFADVRERGLDALGDLIEEHADTKALTRLIDGGAPAGLPTVTGGITPATSGRLSP
jgi:adenosylcobyric acid synthase